MPPAATDKNSQTIGENTPIRVGFILTIVMGSMTLILGSVWWAASINSKLLAIVQTQKDFETSNAQAQRDQNTDIKNLEKEIIQLQSEVQLIQSGGSTWSKTTSEKVTEISERLRIVETHDGPELSSRLTKMEDLASKFRQDFEIYKITRLDLKPDPEKK
jgi:hypothetical protein